MRPRPSETIMTPMQVTIFVIVEHMLPEYKNEVVGRALRRRDKVSVNARNLLNGVLRDNSGKLHIAGFRNASEVPAPKLHLLTAAVARNLHIGKIAEAILRVWEETHKELHEEASAFLQEQHIPVRSSILSKNMQGEWPLEEMVALAEQFSESRPSCQLNDALLMFCCVCARVPLPSGDVVEKVTRLKVEADLEVDAGQLPNNSAFSEAASDASENGTSVQETAAKQTFPDGGTLRPASGTQIAVEDAGEQMPAFDWSDLLAGWRALAPDAIQWERTEEFIAQLRLLAADNYEQRNAGRRALRQALDKLRTENATSLLEFAILALQWSEQNCSADHAEGLAEEVVELHNMLQDYAGLPAPNSRSARQFQERLKIEIVEIGARLHQALAPPAPLDPQTPDIAPEDTPDGEHDSKVEQNKDENKDENETKNETKNEDIAGFSIAAPTAPAQVRLEPQTPLVIPDKARTLEETRASEKADTHTIQSAAGGAAKPIAVAEPDKVAAEAEIVPEQGWLLPKQTRLLGLGEQMSLGEVSSTPEAAAPPYRETPDAASEEKTAEDHTRTDAVGKAKAEKAEAADNSSEKHSVQEDKEDKQDDKAELSKGAEKSADSDEAEENAAAVWSLVAHDDLSGAYWFTRSLEAVGQTCALPAPTLAACQNARWLSFSTFLLLADSRDASPDYVPQGEEAHVLLGFAAAMLPTLLSPNSSFVGWLNAPVSYAGVSGVVDAAREFARFNHPLRPEDLAGAQAPVQREAALRHAAHEAAEWLQEARKKHPSIRRARDIWERLLRRELDVLLAPVAADRRAEAAQARAGQKQYQRREQVQQLLVTLGRELHRRKEMDLQGDVRDGMIRDVMEAMAIADRWCTLAERREQEQEDWFAEHVTELRTRLQQFAPLAFSELEACSRDGSHELRAAAQCLHKALQHLLRTLQILPAEMPNGAQSESAIASDWWLHDEQEREKTLAEALSRRLLWVPEIRVDARPGQTLLNAGDATRLRHLLPVRPATAQSLLAAVEGWLEKRDFRFIASIRLALRDFDDAPALKQRCDDALSRARLALTQAKEQAVMRVDRALIDGVIAEEDSGEGGEAGAASYAASMASIEAMQTEDTTDFEPEFARLRQVEDAVARSEHIKADTLKKLWKELRPALELLAVGEQYRVVCAAVESAFEKRDTRLVDEYFAKIREARDTGGELDLGRQNSGDEQSSSQGQQALDDFLKAEARITETLHENGRGLKDVEQALRNQEAWAGLPFPRISPVRLEEATRALGQWQRLKQKRGYEMEEVESLDALNAVLSYLGFTPPDKFTRPIVKNHSGEWAHVTTRLSTNNLARPIPGFGTLVEHYDIVLLWNRPGMEAVSARLETMRLTGDGVIVFYMDRLKRAHRDKMAQIARGKGFGLAMLDETLLVFLAAQRDARLPAFLRCALPFSAPMPYTPDRAGAVPPEMFFGRDDMARDLQNVNGSCLVYGGRQLGKSALLAHAQREFHQPDNDCYAWVESISAIGHEPLAHIAPEKLYDKIRDKFVEHGLIKGTLATTPDGICKQIRDAVSPQKPGQKSRRVLVMLDEADNFLEADAKSNFRIVARLRDLMQDTQRRFRVVFAGLHHVQKFQSIPNQPLAHFGKPHLVGPLPFREARRLVREPLEALGFRIEEEEVLRILSHTNYHPGLIQNYCQELLKRLYKGGRRETPTHISKADVESIYREPEVRRFISGRFELTLDLDPRYRAIAYAIIVEQIKVRDSYALSYPDYHVLDMVRGWCLPLFKDTSSDDMRALLEEMCGLGVLVRARDHGYRLRSPNLVRLMGTETDIEHRLLELAAQPAYRSNDPESLHPPLDNTYRRYSPLTYTQESALNPRRPGVGMVFASEALGWADLPHAARRCIPEELLKGDAPRAAVLEMPARYTGLEEVGGWLRSQVEKIRACERIVIYQTVPGGTPGLEKRVRAALQFCEETDGARKGQIASLRIFFLLSSDAAWQWLSQSSEALASLEEQMDACTWPRLWNAFGVKQRLRQREMDDRDETCQAIQQATGGWPWLLEKFFEQCSAKTPRQSADKMQQQLFAPASELAQEFRRHLGLPSDSPACRLLKFVLEYQQSEGISQADLLPLVPEIIGDKGEAEAKTQIVPEAYIEFLCRLGCLTRYEHSEQGLMFKAEPFAARLLR